MGIENRITTSQNNLRSNNKGLSLLAVIMWVMITAFLSYYDNNLGFFIKILEIIAVFSLGCFCLSFPFKKGKIFSLVWKIAFLGAGWSGFTSVLLGSVQHNSFGAYTPHLFLLVSTYCLYITVQYILLEISENKNFYNEQ